MVKFEVFVRTQDGESKFRHAFDRESDEFDVTDSNGFKNLFKIDKIFEAPEDILIGQTLTLVANVRLLL